MVTITNGNITLIVTKGAYESMYAPQGWTRVEESASKKQAFKRDKTIKEIIESEGESLAADKISEPNEESDELSDESEIGLSEIPLSQMSVPQLKAYGKQLGIEVDTDSAKTLRNRIRKAQEG